MVISVTGSFDQFDLDEARKDMLMSKSAPSHQPPAVKHIKEISRVPCGVEAKFDPS